MVHVHFYFVSLKLYKATNTLNGLQLAIQIKSSTWVNFYLLQERLEFHRWCVFEQGYEHEHYLSILLFQLTDKDALLLQLTASYQVQA